MLHNFFLFSAGLGGALFLVQLVLSAIGAGDADIDIGGSHSGSTGHTSSDTAFKLLSVQGLAAFFAIFGLSGLALSQQAGLPLAVVVAGATAGGAFTTFVLARIFRAAKKLEGSGTLDMSNAIDQEATVYLRVAPNKPGKVTLTLQGRLVEVDAAAEGETFETGERVRVIRALPNGSLLVGKA